VRPSCEGGQALVAMVAALCAVAIAAVLLGSVASALGGRDDRQRAVDLAALAAARAMRTAYPQLFVPATADRRVNPRHLDRAGYLSLGRRVALEVARRNGTREVKVTFPDAAEMAPVRVRVAAAEPVAVLGQPVAVAVHAEATLSPAAGAGAAASGEGEYRGPLAIRQGKPMRPDVALAFDRMAAAARADGIALIVASGFRSNAEQAALFAAHPDPKWVAPPGKSLHRLGTELDLGPAAAYGWLARNAERFHFRQRYSWEPWHYGFVLNSRSSQWFPRRRGDGAGGATLPSFVPVRFAPAIARAAQRWNVSAALLAAQIWQESKFNPFARSAAGAQGIAQFMPGTAAAYGLRDPFDAGEAIDAQAHHMRDLLRRFASVPLALAAYNAGPAPVARCGCVPPIPETTSYVTAILGLLGGAGDSTGVALEVRLVE
jgi:hypothetical protein